MRQKWIFIGGVLGFLSWNPLQATGGCAQKPLSDVTCNELCNDLLTGCVIHVEEGAGLCQNDYGDCIKACHDAKKDTARSADIH